MNDEDDRYPGEASGDPGDRTRETASIVPAGGGAFPRVEGFRIVRFLGRGGMGEVYEAEQENPPRPVALKIVRAGHAGDELAVRLFQREGRALARLRHRGIAAIHAAGHTADGRSWFAMELVRGRTLDRFLADRPDPARSRSELDLRLRLFLRLSEAIRYAHQRGVVHRDLKPSNVMVVEGEADPEVKVLDFGLARVTEADVEAVTQVTALGAVQGTLAYMSPEQARGNPDEIDLRTDVYSLGVILYEMLVGRRPCPVEGRSLYEAIRVIQEVEPASFAEVFGGRSPYPRDLELIVRTALAKDPARRYQGVAELIDDLRRFRERRPILARPPSLPYVLRRAIDRHRVGFAAGATFLAMLVALGVVLVQSYHRVRQERDRASAVVAFLTDLFELPDPTKPDRERIDARELLERGARRVRENRRLAPRLRASLMDTIGQVMLRLGLYREALPMLEEAWRIAREAYGPDSLEAAEVLLDLGWARAEANDYGGAEKAYREVLATRRRELGEDDPSLVAPLVHLGNLAWERHDFRAAEGYYREAIEIARSAEGGDERQLATARNNLGILLAKTGRPAEGEAFLQEALAARERLYGPSSLLVSTTLNNLAELYRGEGDTARAEPLYRRALEIRRALLDPGDPRIAVLLNNLGEVYRAEGDLARAEEHYRQALEIFERALPANDPLVGLVAFNLGEVALGQGKGAVAEVFYRKSLGISRAAARPDPRELAETEIALGESLVLEGRLGEAEETLETARVRLDPVAPPDDPLRARRLEALADLRERQGRRAEAGRLRERAAAIRAARGRGGKNWPG